MINPLEFERRARCIQLCPPIEKDQLREIVAITLLYIPLTANTGNMCVLQQRRCITECPSVSRKNSFLVSYGHAGDSRGRAAVMHAVCSNSGSPASWRVRPQGASLPRMEALR